ncbi:MAG TPA: ribonuclease M5 [Erysipelothrix sp.]|nr:ribonuclease M5 [Erysipelothrix sp.]
MEKLVIQETIVVEGKHDVDKIKTCVKADVLTTSGTHLSLRTLELIKQANNNRGVIVFTDPDAPGEMIRTKIIEAIGECKHASLSLSQSKAKGKVGIEHASCEDIIHALKSVATLNPNQKTLSRQEFMDLGLSGQKDSQEKRDALSSYLNIPKTNAKRAFKYLNMMGYNKKKIEDILKELASGNDRK